MGFFAGGFDFDTVRANAGNIPEQWLPLIVFALVIGLGVKLAACSTFGCLMHTCRGSYARLSTLVSCYDRNRCMGSCDSGWSFSQAIRTIQFVYQHVGSCNNDIRRCDGSNAG